MVGTHGGHHRPPRAGHGGSGTSVVTREPVSGVSS